MRSKINILNNYIQCMESEVFHKTENVSFSSSHGDNRGNKGWSMLASTNLHYWMQGLIIFRTEKFYNYFQWLP